jgi:hypothetical protein
LDITNDQIGVVVSHFNLHRHISWLSPVDFDIANRHNIQILTQQKDSTAMSANWYTSKIAPEGAKDDGCDAREAQALKDYLDDNITVREAAQAITSPISAENHPRDCLHRLWAFLTDALVELSDSQIPSIIKLLLSIQQLPPLSPQGETSSGPSQKELKWTELEGFGHMWVDLNHNGNWRKDFSNFTTSQKKDLKEAYVRRASVEAQMVAAKVSSIPLSWGYETVCGALEEKEAILDIELPAVREWLTTAGKLFRAATLAEERSYALEWKHDLWKGEPHMCEARWEFWETRLKDFAEQRGILDEETLQAAESALRALKEAK